MKRYHDILTIFVLMLATSVVLTGCREPVEPTQRQLQLQFLIPVDAAPPVGRRKVMGDPGTSEMLSLPRYAYMFVVIKKKDGTYELRTVVNEDLYEGKSGDSEVWERVDTDGGDVIYRCIFNLIDETLAPTTISTIEYARVYAAMSKLPLQLKTSDGTVITDGTTVYSDRIPEDEAGIRDIRFTVTDELQAELQNIYSTPYNHTTGGKYYASLVVGREVMSGQVQLYHTAAKVDLQWDVPYEEHVNLQIAGIREKNLFKGDSYLFRPLENVRAPFTASDGYTPTDSITGDQPATWWAGRTHFYTIFYRTGAGGAFPLQADFWIRNTDTESAGYRAAPYKYGETFTMSVSGDVFTPWLRCRMTVGASPTGDRTETKELSE